MRHPTASLSKLILPIENPFEYEVTVPGSKSIALRQLFMSALSHEQSMLIGLPPCDDIDAMLDCLRRLGAKFSGSLASGLRIRPGFNLVDDITLDVQQSGVTLRLLLAAAALRTGITHFTGHASMASRPNGPLLVSIEELGCHVESQNGKLPISIRGPSLHSHVQLDASASSQYLSALLLIAPLLSHGLTISMKGKVASTLYALGTINEAAKRGVVIHGQHDAKQFVVEPQNYHGGQIRIEGDASAATYHMAMATLHQSTVHISNVGRGSWQPDCRFAEICKDLGAEVTQCNESTVVCGPEELQPIPTVDMSDIPDAALTLMAISPYLDESIELQGLATLPHKECDRITCPTSELRRAGIRVEHGSDWMKIWPGTPAAAEFQTYNDHRMAMSFAVLATKSKGCRITDPRCVNKTYTHFWRDLSLAYAM